MSRVGLKPIPIPDAVNVQVTDRVIQVKGPKGSLMVDLSPGISAELGDDGRLTLSRADEEKQTRAFHGLNRALVANAVTGVSDGWQKELQIVGIGYRAAKEGNAVVFNLGYSHPIRFEEPEGITIDVDAKANKVTVQGIDRQRVGQVAANIRGLRPPEPYKGKGVRYAGERVVIKPGKQGAK